MPRAMNPDEVVRLVAQPQIAVLSVADPTGRPPHQVPIWYLVEPTHDLVLVTGPRSRKARLMLAAGQLSLCIMDRSRYRYATVEGTVTGTVPTTTEHRRRIAERYLGADNVESYLAATAADQAESIAISVHPHRMTAISFVDIGDELKS